MLLFVMLIENLFFGWFVSVSMWVLLSLCEGCRWCSRRLCFLFFSDTATFETIAYGRCNGKPSASLSDPILLPCFTIDLVQLDCHWTIHCKGLDYGDDIYVDSNGLSIVDSKLSKVLVDDNDDQRDPLPMSKRQVILTAWLLQAPN